MLDARGNAGGSMTELNKILKVVEKLQLTEEEVKHVNLRLEDGALKWSTKGEDGSDLDPAKEIELADEQVDLLKTMLKEKDEKKEFKMAEAGPVNEIVKELELEL